MKRLILPLVSIASVCLLATPPIGVTAPNSAKPHHPLAQPSATATALHDGYALYLPFLEQHLTSLAPIVPETTNVLDDPTARRLMSVSADGTDYTFSGMTPMLQRVAPGEVLVGAPAAAAPNGILRRVTAVSGGAGGVVVRTQAATLEDAIQQGDIRFSRRLTADGLPLTVLAPGVTLRPSSARSTEASFFVEIQDVVLFDEDGDFRTTADQVVANGSVLIEPTLNFDMRIRQSTVESLRFTIDAKETADLALEMRVQRTLLAEKQLGSPVHLPAFVVMVGVVPVAFTPVLTFQIGVDGKVHVGIATSVKQVLDATAGATYSDAGWRPLSRVNSQYTYVPPTLYAGADVRGYASTRLQLLLYGVVGPYGDLRPYLKLEADTMKTPWWQLLAGLDVPVGVRVDILGYKRIASYEVLAIGVRQLLRQAQTPPPTTSTRTPTRTATATPTLSAPPSRTPTPTPTRQTAADPCAAIPGESYASLAVQGPATDRPAEAHGDLNLDLRGHQATAAARGFVDFGPAADPLAPQLAGLFGDRRTPTFSSTHRVFDWDWRCNCRGGLLTAWEVTLLGMAISPAEPIRVPDSGYSVGSGYEALVLYASPNRITLKYTPEDNVVRGYTLHVEDVCVAPGLQSLYDASNASGRGRLPALVAGQPFGRARGDEIKVSVRDGGVFFDPRSRQDWWRGR